MTINGTKEARAELSMIASWATITLLVNCFLLQIRLTGATVSGAVLLIGAFLCLLAGGEIGRLLQSKPKLTKWAKLIGLAGTGGTIIYAVCLDEAVTTHLLDRIPGLRGTVRLGVYQRWELAGLLWRVAVSALMLDEFPTFDGRWWPMFVFALFICLVGYAGATLVKQQHEIHLLVVLGLGLLLTGMDAVCTGWASHGHRETCRQLLWYVDAPMTLGFAVVVWFYFEQHGVLSGASEFATGAVTFQMISGMIAYAIIKAGVVARPDSVPLLSKATIGTR